MKKWLLLILVVLIIFLVFVTYYVSQNNQLAEEYLATAERFNEMGQPDEAFKVAEKALNSGINFNVVNKKTRYWIYIIYCRKFYKNGNWERIRAMSTDPKTINIFFGMVLINDEEFAKAFEICKWITRNVPEDRTAYDLLAICYWKMGQIDKAMETLDKLEELINKGFGKAAFGFDITLGDIYFLKATIYKSIGKYSQSLEYYDKALSRLDKDLRTGNIYLRKAELYFLLKQSDKAMMEVNKALKLLEQALSDPNPDKQLKRLYQLAREMKKENMPKTQSTFEEVRERH